MEFLEVILATTQAATSDGVDCFRVHSSKEGLTCGHFDCTQDFFPAGIHLDTIDPDGRHRCTDSDRGLMGLGLEADGRLGCDRGGAG